MDDKLLQLKRLKGSLPAFASEMLKIRAKSGDILPFELNSTQLHLHKLLEQQRRDKGWVRALILKGRQPGVSTYVAARYYHQASLGLGTNVYILAHEQPASDNLFGIVDRYQRNNPLAPHVGTSNAKELVFDKLDSSYVVATAGTKAGGRSRALSLFHGSEAAFWANAKDHFAASIQGIPLLPNTEIILESTSAGAGGEFYERWLDAEAGRGDYMPVFLPWWWTKEYTRDPGPGFELSQEADDGEMSEQEYADAYELSNGQMAWRRGKLLELRDPLLFRREYPATPAEAWTAPAGHEPFISPISVARARKRKREGHGPLVLGVDPASNGGDRFAVAARRGTQVLWVRHRNKIDTLEGTAWIRSLIDELSPSRVNIDAGNIGAAIITNLKSIGPDYVKVVRGVNFGGTSQWRLATPNVPGPRNVRAEIWMRLRDWLLAPEGVELPDNDALQTDLTAPRLKPQLDNSFLLESKIDMGKRNVRSPDLADAVALTFTFVEFLQNYSEQPKVSAFGNPESYQPTQAETWFPSHDGGANGWMGG